MKAGMAISRIVTKKNMERGSKIRGAVRSNKFNICPFPLQITGKYFINYIYYSLFLIKAQIMYNLVDLGCRSLSPYYAIREMTEIGV